MVTAVVVVADTMYLGAVAHNGEQKTAFMSGTHGKGPSL